jgi:hypothetical protein
MSADRTMELGWSTCNTFRIDKVGDHVTCPHQETEKLDRTSYFRTFAATAGKNHPTKR